MTEFLVKKFVKDLLSREDICGAVITHGTDSLEETAQIKVEEI